MGASTSILYERSGDFIERMPMHIDGTRATESERSREKGAMKKYAWRDSNFAFENENGVAQMVVMESSEIEVTRQLNRRR